MCLRVKMTGFVRAVLLVLGSVADTTADITMVLVALVVLVKKLGLRMSAMSV